MIEQLSLMDLFERPTAEALFKPDQIYDSDDYALFTRLTEDDRFDRKSGRVQARGLAVCLSAFGNGRSMAGGVIAVGIENDRRITGCKDLDEAQLQAIESVGRNICPDGRFRTKRVEAINHKGEKDFIVLIRIAYVEDRLVTLTNGEAYIREASDSRLLTEHEKTEIRIDKGERSFELESCALSYPEDFQKSQIQRFCHMIRERREGSPSISDEEILQAMHLGRLRTGAFIPNNACVLLFANDPQQIFPGAYVHLLRYQGNKEQSGKDFNVVKDRIIGGTVLDVIKDSASFIDANIREFTQFRDGKFYSLPEYPRDAWYELLVNACVHRSYNVRNAPIFIKLFDDHMAVESPGGFMPQVTPETIYGTHRPRNPFLMLVLREFGEVRCISEGTQRVRTEMRDANLPAPEFMQETQGKLAVRAVLRNDIANRTNSLDSEAYKVLGEAMAFTLSHDERKIVNYVIEHGQINASDALRILSTTYWHTARARLQGLVKRGILDFVSSKQRDPKAHYVLVKRASQVER